MKPPHSDDHLRDVLATWTEVPAPDKELDLRVEQAIARERVSTKRAAAWRSWNLRIGWNDLWFRCACACIAAGALVGIGTAEWRRGREVAQAPSRYLEWIAPQSPAPRP